MTAAKPKRAAQLGVTDAEYARLLAAQDGHCALCPSTPKSRRLHVDHDHATGAVRGLLCHRCNRNLPTWVTPAWCAQAILYLSPALYNYSLARVAGDMALHRAIDRVKVRAAP